MTGGSGPVFAGVVGLDVTDNTITGPGSVGITLIGRENANLRVARNTITGMSDAGISLALNPRSAVENRDVAILQNTILDTGGDGVRIGAGGADGPVTVTENRIVDSSRAGLRNQDDDAAVNAQRNWWGCNLGPGFEGCGAVTSPDGGTHPGRHAVVDPVTGRHARRAGRRREQQPARPPDQPQLRRARRRPVLPRGPGRVRLAAGRRHLRPADHAPDHARACGHDRLHRRAARRQSGR